MSNSLRIHALRSAFLLSILLVLAGGSAAAEDPPAVEADGTMKKPTANDADARYRFSSDKDAQDRDGAVKGRGLGPHGPSMDGIRGSGIAPAPGAFGTDAGSPSDLRR